MTVLPMVRSTVLLAVSWSALAAVPAAESPQGDDCAKCGYRAVYMYDVTVLTQNPFAFVPNAQCANDPDCLERWTRWLDQWKLSHQVSYWYKRALRPKTDASSEECVTFFGRMPFPSDAWATPDLYEPTRSSDWKVNVTDYPVTEGLDPKPTYSSVPPDADRIDYLVYGTLTDGLQLKVTLRNFRRNEDIWYSETLFDPRDPERGVSYEGAVRQVVGDSAAKVVQSIRGYEVVKRDEADASGGLVAIEPKLEFAKSAYGRKSETGEEEEIELRLIDCDDHPLKNRRVSLAASAGTLSQSSVVTDGEGRARVRYKAPNGLWGNPRITASWPFEYPSGRTNEVKASVPIVPLYEWIQAKIELQWAGPTQPNDDTRCDPHGWRYSWEGLLEPSLLDPGGSDTATPGALRALAQSGFPAWSYFGHTEPAGGLRYLPFHRSQVTATERWTCYHVEDPEHKLAMAYRVGGNISVSVRLWLFLEVAQDQWKPEARLEVNNHTTDPGLVYEYDAETGDFSLVLLDFQMGPKGGEYDAGMQLPQFSFTKRDFTQGFDKLMPVSDGGDEETWRTDGKLTGTVRLTYKREPWGYIFEM